jgi:hypothetical protein
MRFFPKNALTAKPTPVQMSNVKVQLQQNWIRPQMPVRFLPQCVTFTMPFVPPTALYMQPNRMRTQQYYMPGYNRTNWQMAHCQAWYQGGMGNFGRPVF